MAGDHGSVLTGGVINVGVSGPGVVKKAVDTVRVQTLGHWPKL